MWLWKKNQPKKFFPEALVNKGPRGLRFPNLSGQVLLQVMSSVAFCGRQRFQYVFFLSGFSRQCFIAADIPFLMVSGSLKYSGLHGPPFSSLFLIWWIMVQEWAFQKLPSFVVKVILLFYKCLHTYKLDVVFLRAQVLCELCDIKWLSFLFSPPL